MSVNTKDTTINPYYNSLLKNNALTLLILLSTAILSTILYNCYNSKKDTLTTKYNNILPYDLIMLETTTGSNLEEVTKNLQTNPAVNFVTTAIVGDVLTKDNNSFNIPVLVGIRGTEFPLVNTPLTDSTIITNQRSSSNINIYSNDIFSRIDNRYRASKPTNYKVTQVTPYRFLNQDTIFTSYKQAKELLENNYSNAYLLKLTTPTNFPQEAFLSITDILPGFKPYYLFEKIYNEYTSKLNTLNKTTILLYTTLFIIAISLIYLNVSYRSIIHKKILQYNKNLSIQEADKRELSLLRNQSKATSRS